MKRRNGQVLDRGAAGRAGGWFESAKDVTGKWLFLKEVSLKQTIPKMERLSALRSHVLDIFSTFAIHFEYICHRFPPCIHRPHMLSGAFPTVFHDFN